MSTAIRIVAFLSIICVFSALAPKLRASTLLHPDNSLMQPAIEFKHNGHTYYIGIWDIIVIGHSFALVKKIGNSYHFRVIYEVSEKDVSGSIENSGGIDIFLANAIEAFNVVLVTTYPDFSAYANEVISYDGNELVIN